MNVAWLVLDSLSYASTPFAPDGPDTMPELSLLAEQTGIVYENAYVPGPTSPSSHGSFFTGEPPSITGMHEAYPYFDSDIRTIGDLTAESHESMLISANPYIFNGLGRGFDVTNDLREEEFLVFPEARNPKEFRENNEFESRLRKYLTYTFGASKPLRSLVNAVKFKQVMRQRRSSLPERSTEDENKFQYADSINARIREFLKRTDDDAFIVANYMDIHPPLDASEEALERFSGDYSPEDLPIGSRGQDVYERYREGDEGIANRMDALERATIWDTDRKIASLVAELLERDTFVVVTADHGNWYRREHELDERRIHVPLVILGPDIEPRRVSETVNLLSLPKTTLSAINHPKATTPPGKDLLRVEEDDISVTEFIYTSDERGKPVNPKGEGDKTVKFDMAAVRGADRFDYIDNAFIERRGDGNQEDLRQAIESHLENYESMGDRERIEYDEEVEQRLKDFGYL